MAMPVLSLLLLPLTVAASDVVPTFNVEPSCRGGLSDSKDSERLQRCLAEEAAARAQLQAGWANFPAGDRTNCVAAARISTPSYVELLTCLEMAVAARKNPAQ